MSGEKPRVFSDKPPSDDFMDAVRSGGSIVTDCEACGRVFFEDDESAGDWEDGELEKLRQNAKTNPDKYFAMDRVETADIDGKHIVVNCPCNYLTRLEQWIWSHRRIIATYISKRAQAAAERALEDEAESHFLEENVNLLDGYEKGI